MLTCQPLPAPQALAAAVATLRRLWFETLLRQPLSRESATAVLLDAVVSLLLSHADTCPQCDAEPLQWRLELILRAELDAHTTHLHAQSRKIVPVIGATSLNHLVHLGAFDADHMALAAEHLRDLIMQALRDKRLEAPALESGCAAFAGQVLAELLYLPGLPYRIDHWPYVAGDLAHAWLAAKEVPVDNSH
jgi:hypothetical protein